MLQRVSSVIVGIVLVGGIVSDAQVPTAEEAAATRAADARRVRTLMHEGHRLEGRHIVLWYADPTPGAEAADLVSRLDPAVGYIRDRVGQQEWQLHAPRAKITYYISDEPRFQVHGGEGGIFYSLASIRAGRLLFLYEAALRSNLPRWRTETPNYNGMNDPLWLYRGVNDYLTKTAGIATGFKDTDVFDSGLPDEADARCAMRARTPAGAAMLREIGRWNRPVALFGTEIATYGPPFYSCALSFAKFLIDRAGLPTTVALVSANSDRAMDEMLQRATTRTLTELRSEWLRRLGLTESDPPPQGALGL